MKVCISSEISSETESAMRETRFSMGLQLAARNHLIEIIRNINRDRLTD